jgi:FkbM family methyltransferase
MKYLHRIKNKFAEKKTPSQGWFETEFDGLRWRFLMSDYIDRTIALTHKFEPSTIELVKKIVKPEMRVLDIGANIGYYTLYLAKLVGSTGTVFAIEPVQRFRERLMWMIVANGFEDRVKVIPYGVSDCRDTVEIEIDHTSATLHQIRTISEGLFRERIELDTLDALDSRMDISPIDFIKVDIDGHEPFMLDGSKSFFLKNRPVMVMEFSQLSLDVAGSDVREVKKRLDELGYVLFSEKTLAPMNRRQFLIECGNFNRSANAWAIPEEMGIKNLRELF